MSAPFNVPASSVGGLQFLYVLTILVGVQWYLGVVLICISVMANDGAFHVLVHIYLLWRSVYSNPLPVFLVGLFVSIVEFLAFSAYSGYKFLLSPFWIWRDIWIKVRAGVTILTVGGVRWQVRETSQRMHFVPRRGFLQGRTLEGKCAELSGHAWACSLFNYTPFRTPAKEEFERFDRLEGGRNTCWLVHWRRNCMGNFSFFFFFFLRSIGFYFLSRWDGT